MSLVALMLLGTPSGGRYQACYELVSASGPALAYPLAAWYAKASSARETDDQAFLERVLVLGTRQALGEQAVAGGVGSSEAFRALQDELADLGVERELIVAVPWEIDTPSAMAGSLLAVLGERWESVLAGATLVVDVTFGFRTQPMVLLESLELIEGRFGATVYRIIYGRQDNHGTGTIDDVTELLRLRQASFATRTIAQTGRFTAASASFRALASSRSDHRDTQRAGLEQVAKGLEELDLLMQLAQAGRSLQSVRRLLEGLQGVSTGEDAAFAALAHALRRALDQSPLLGRSSEAGEVGTLVALVEHFCDTKQVGLGLLVGWEALVTLWLVLKGGDPEGQPRRVLEQLLRQVARPGSAAPSPKERDEPALRLEEKEDPELVRRLAEPVPHPDGTEMTLAELGKFQETVRDLRNDVAHSGWRTGARSGQPRPRKYQEKLEQVLGLLRRLEQAAGPGGSASPKG